MARTQNMKIWTINGTHILQSYNVYVAAKRPDGTWLVDEYYQAYSKTTTKHISQFFVRSASQWRKMVNAGAIIAIDLNKEDLKW